MQGVSDATFDDPLIRRILNKVLGKLDDAPSSERANALRVNLDETTAPEIFTAESLEARDLSWAAIDRIVDAQWFRIGYRLHRHRGSREERRPYLDAIWNDDLEELIRLRLNRPRKSTSYIARWRALLERSDPPFSEAELNKLAAACIEIEGRPLEEVFARFLSVRSLANEPLLLREVSSRVFWGLSKILDGRSEAVAALLGREECPFLEQPIVLNIHVTQRPSSFLFVENHVSFERLKRRSDLQDYALVFSSGFRGAALRLRRPGGVSLYYTRQSSAAAIEAFEAAIYSDTEVSTFFWGDLDHAGMAILASLRLSFIGAEAWKPGYEPMLARLRNADGHLPTESGKERQRPIEKTGCRYADNVLIPALLEYGKFLDQE